MRAPVVVLSGGTSRERRVSVASAQHLVEVLAEREDATRWWFWAPDGVVIEHSASELAAHQRPFETDFAPRGDGRRWPSIDRALDSLADVEAGAVVLLALHGGDGENGAVQAALEERRLAFTASGSEASRLAFDKDGARSAVHRVGVNVAEAVTFDPLDGGTWEAVRALQITHGQVVLKPVADGSSFGLRFVTDTDDLMPALEDLAELPEPVFHLAERYVEGRELTVGVMEGLDGEVSALPPSEVLVEGAAFDFDAKYLGRGALEITPADLDDGLREAVQQVALKAHEALGCEGYSRTDVIVEADGSVVFLETNTLPGLTKASFIPQQLAAAGIPIGDFLDAQLDLAVRRRDHPR